MATRLIAALRGVRPAAGTAVSTSVALVLGLVLLNQLVNVGATVCFAASAHADRLRTFLIWQFVGGLFGLGVQLSFAGLVRFWSLTAANVVGIGVAFVSVQIVVAYIIFSESFHATQWLGTAFVFAGLVLVAVGHH